jgi:hypothetical protein
MIILLNAGLSLLRMETAIEQKCDNWIIGDAKISKEFSRFGYANEIKTLGKYFFDYGGIYKALQQLVSVNDNPDVFMNLKYSKFAPEPSQWQPKLKHERINMDDEIEVYFKNINFEIKTGKFEKWYEPMALDFLPLAKHMPCGVKEMYFYQKGSEKARHSDEFNPDDKAFYEAFAYMFGGALKAFSCFCSYGKIDINSNTYIDEPNFRDHSGTGRWKGKLGDFLESAKVLSGAVKHLAEEKGYKNEEMRRQVMYGEVRLIHPNYGMIIMRPESEAYEIDHPEHYGSAERKVFMPSTLILSKKAVGLLEEELKNN